MADYEEMPAFISARAEGGDFIIKMRGEYIELMAMLAAVTNEIAKSQEMDPFEIAVMISRAIAMHTQTEGIFGSGGIER